MWITLCLLVVVLVILLAKVIYWYYCKKFLPPGPIPYPIIGTPKPTAIHPDLCIWHDKMRRKYGDVFTVYEGSRPTIVGELHYFHISACPWPYIFSVLTLAGLSTLKYDFCVVSGHKAIGEILNKKGSFVSARAKGVGVLSLLHDNAGLYLGHNSRWWVISCIGQSS